MLDVCSAVGKSIGIKFNSRKSSCLIIGPNAHGTPTPMSIGGEQIQWAQKLKYLGITLNSSSVFTVDLSEIRRKFYVAINSILSQCNYTSDIIKLELVEKHCLPILLYCIESLDLDCASIKLLNSWWNSAYRKIFGYHKWESVKCLIRMLGRFDVHHIANLRSISFVKRLEVVNNSFLSVVYNEFVASAECVRLLRMYNVRLDWSFSRTKHELWQSFTNICNV
jgi:hypothetical protein